MLLVVAPFSHLLIEISVTGKQQNHYRRPQANAMNVQHQLTDCIVCVKL